MDLIEAQRIHVDILVDRDSAKEPPLRHDEVECLVRRPREGNWRKKELAPGSWLALGHGVYSLRLDPEDLPEPGSMSVLLQGEFEPALTSFRVVSRLQSSATDVMLTTLVGRVVGVDGKPKAKAPVVAKLASAPPVYVGGAAVGPEPITVETDEHGDFSMSLVTGAQVQVTIQAVNWAKQFVVPPPPAAGLPVRMFSL